MQVSAEIFSQGEEIITGQTVDTNAAWLAEQLVSLGFTVRRHTAVGDNLADLIALLQEIAQRADCCICTGGLGPTCDDLTAEAVSLAFNLPLVFDPVAYAQIEAFFIQRQQTMPAANRKQALLPQGALRIDNPVGTAPGFAVQLGHCWFVFVPGVPAEMQALFNNTIKQELQQQFCLQPKQLVTLKTVGIGESAIQNLIECIPIPDEVHLGFRAGIEEVQTKLLFPHAYPQSDKMGLIQQFAAQIGDFVFAIEGLDTPARDLVAVIDQALAATQQTVAVVETLSQGLIAAKCVGYAWLAQSVYQQSLTRLTATFAVNLNEQDLPVTALHLARAVQQQSLADFALVQLCTNNPNDTTHTTLYTVLATDYGAYPQQLKVHGNLKRQQNQAALLALDLLRRFLYNQHTIPCHYYA